MHEIMAVPHSRRGETRDLPRTHGERVEVLLTLTVGDFPVHADSLPP
jgi:hypothetical protein